MLDEPESQALEHAVRGSALVSSEIALVEVARACKRAVPEEDSRARQLLGSVYLVEVKRPVIEHAARLAGESLRSLDAIHLASALYVRGDVLIAYDRRLLDAAAVVGLDVASPGA